MKCFHPIIFSLAIFLFFVGSVTVAHAAITTSGDVNPADPTTWDDLTNAYIGSVEDGTGSVTVTEGDSILCCRGFIGHHSGSTGTVTISGTDSISGDPSTWTCYNHLMVGGYGDGTLNITNGGYVSNEYYSYIGYYLNSSSVVTVDGSGSTWYSDGDLAISYFGTGTLNITNGGAVTVTGTVDVDADQCGTKSGSIDFGTSGGGTLSARTLYASPSQLVGQGTINARGIVMDLDVVFDSTHDVIQTMTLNSQSGQNIALNLSVGSYGGAGDLGAGYRGNGSLTIADGKVVYSESGFLGHHIGSTGTATVSGTDTAWNMSGKFHVGHYGDGTLSITGGAEVSNGNGSIGDNFYSTNYSFGEVTVDGSGSTWTNSGCLNVGHYGSGTLDIANGGYVSNTDGYIGKMSSSLSGVTVNASTWHNSGDLFVGNYGDGSLYVTGAGTVYSHDGCIAERSTSTSSVTICSDSTWYNYGELCVGCRGDATLAISTGGNVTNTNAVIGDLAGSSGEVTVYWSGSTWTNSGTLTIGDAGSGTLSITSNADVSNTDGYVACQSGSSGQVTVSGSDSTWTNSGSLLVGGEGQGTLDIRSNGLVKVRGAMYIDYYLDNENNAMSTGNSFITMSNSGKLALWGDYDDSLSVFFNRISGTDAILWWNPGVGDWSLLTTAVEGEDYTLEYREENYLAGYTVLTVTAIEPGPGDANCDGVVDGSDATILANYWQHGVGMTNPDATWAMGDFNGDHVVDGSDATILASYWQTGVEGTNTAVPEPGCVALMLTLLAAGIAFVARKRR